MRKIRDLTDKELRRLQQGLLTLIHKKSKSEPYPEKESDRTLVNRLIVMRHIAEKENH